MVQTIRNLALNVLTRTDYENLITLFLHMVNKYKWPKLIIEDDKTGSSHWGIDDISSLLHQFAIFIQKEQKLVNAERIPDEYLEYYFHQVIITYVASKIDHFQSSRGISFKSIRRTALNILNEDYCKKVIGKRTYWCSSDEKLVDQFEESNTDKLVEYLPRVVIKLGSKQHKPYVNRALTNIFSVLSNAIEEGRLIDTVYRLIEQPGIPDADTEIIIDTIDKAEIRFTVRKLIDGLEVNDAQLLYDYFLANKRSTIRDLSEKYKEPKSSIHQRIKALTAIISNTFTPSGYHEGEYFLECLKNTLDKSR